MIDRADESRRTPSRRAFTLVELLVVVAIIAVLLAILLPALSTIRKSAKATRTASMISTIEKSLNVFHNDFNEYPDSAAPSGQYLRPDPVVNWPAVAGLPAPANLNSLASADSTPLTGAHWLARALVGHDRNGVDVEGKTLGRLVKKAEVNNASINQPIDYYKYYSPADKNGLPVDRRPAYLEGEFFARDDDPAQFNVQTSPTSDYEPRRRLVVREESFGSPVLYYRANPQAEYPFCRTGFGDDRMGSQSGDLPGVYCHQDNSYMTGDDQSSQSQHSQGWDFAGTAQAHATDPGGKGYTHALAIFGVDVQNVAAIEHKQSFVEFFRNPDAAGQAVDSDGRSISITPYNRDTFILLSAGPDGAFGTSDDIGNVPIKK